jgi:hypothetical protein
LIISDDVTYSATTPNNNCSAVEWLGFIYEMETCDKSIEKSMETIHTNCIIIDESMERQKLLLPEMF